MLHIKLMQVIEGYAMFKANLTLGVWFVGSGQILNCFITTN